MAAPAAAPSLQVFPASPPSVSPPNSIRQLHPISPPSSVPATPPISPLPNSILNGSDIPLNPAIYAQSCRIPSPPEPNTPEIARIVVVFLLLYYATKYILDPFLAFIWGFLRPRFRVFNLGRAAPPEPHPGEEVADNFHMAPPPNPPPPQGEARRVLIENFINTTSNVASHIINTLIEPFFQDLSDLIRGTGTGRR